MTGGEFALAIITIGIYLAFRSDDTRNEEALQKLADLERDMNKVNSVCSETSRQAKDTENILKALDENNWEQKS